MDYTIAIQHCRGKTSRGQDYWECERRNCYHLVLDADAILGDGYIETTDHCKGNHASNESANHGWLCTTNAASIADFLLLQTMFPE